MTRREARETAMTLLYERACRADTDAREVYERSLSLRDIEENDYIKEVYFGVWDSVGELDEKIAGAAIGWSLERMSKVTLAILRLAAYELYHMPTIPKSVTLNEAVELSKQYDDAQASPFVNGILSRIAEDETIEKVAVPRKGGKS